MQIRFSCTLLLTLSSTCLFYSDASAQDLSDDQRAKIGQSVAAYAMCLQQQSQGRVSSSEADVDNLVLSCAAEREALAILTGSSVADGIDARMKARVRGY